MSFKETKFGVKIVEVVSPVKFIALKSSLGCPNEEDETYTYKQLDEELNVHYNNWTESPVSGEQPYRPTKIGELVAVWQVDRRHWYRGSIKALYARQQFREAVVYLIDEARDVKLKVYPQGIRYLKPEFARFPWRSVTLRLDQLAPITLQLEIGATLAANNRVANKWDEHALTFVQQTIKDHRKFNFVSSTTDGGWHVGRLYMSDGGRHNIEICLNDLLVEKQYATYADCGSLDLGINSGQKFCTSHQKGLELRSQLDFTLK